jgi:hypothetical protein
MEPDGIMQGSAWPPEWQTGWVTFRYSDIRGTPLTGTVTLTNSADRAVAQTSKTTVYKGEVTIPLVNGAPGGPDAQENSEGIMCIEFPIGDDPDIIPTEMQMLARESFSGNTVIRTKLTAEHTLDNPLWLSGSLDAVVAQAGVIQRLTYWVDLEASGVPAGAQVGDAIVFLDTRKMFVIESL